MKCKIYVTNEQNEEKPFKTLQLENMICAIMLRRENVESQFLGNSYLNVHISDLILSCAFHGGIGSNFIFCSKLNFGFCVYNFGLMVYITIKLLPKWQLNSKTVFLLAIKENVHVSVNKYKMRGIE